MKSSPAPRRSLYNPEEVSVLDSSFGPRRRIENISACRAPPTRPTPVVRRGERTPSSRATSVRLRRTPCTRTPRAYDSGISRARREDPAPVYRPWKHHLLRPQERTMLPRETGRARSENNRGSRRSRIKQHKVPVRAGRPRDAASTSSCRLLPCPGPRPRVPDAGRPVVDAGAAASATCCQDARPPSPTMSSIPLRFDRGASPFRQAPSRAGLCAGSGEEPSAEAARPAEAGPVPSLRWLLIQSLTLRIDRGPPRAPINSASRRQ